MSGQSDEIPCGCIIPSLIDRQGLGGDFYCRDGRLCNQCQTASQLTAAAKRVEELEAQLAAMKAVAAELAHSATILQGHAWLSRFEAADYANKLHEQSPDHANQIAVYINSFCDRLIEDCNKITTNGEGER